MDYVKGSDPSWKQLDVMKFQLNLAKVHDKPVVLHLRGSKAMEDWLDKRIQIKKTVIVHSATSTLKWCKLAIETIYNIYFAINGLIFTDTKEGSNMRNIVRIISIKYLLLETDSPKLMIQNIGGREKRQSSMKELLPTIKRIWEMRKVKNETLLMVADQLYENAKDAFFWEGPEFSM